MAGKIQVLCKIIQQHKQGNAIRVDTMLGRKLPYLFYYHSGKSHTTLSSSSLSLSSR